MNSSARCGNNAHADADRFRDANAKPDGDT
jgi:hypothetical protein